MKKSLLALIILGILAAAGVGFGVYSQFQLKSETTKLTQEFQATATQYAITTDKNYETMIDLTSEKSELLSEIDVLNSYLLCSDRTDEIDYTSNATVSASLEDWVETMESIDTAKWDTVWSNDLTAIHELSGEYLFEYIVYFDNPEMGTVNAVFDVSGMCFLDINID